MYKFIVLYFTPEDPEHFRQYYEEVHVNVGAHPLIKKRSYTFDVNNVESPVAPAPANVFCYFEAELESEADFVALMSDPAGQAAAQDTANFATGGLMAMHFAVD